MPPRNSLKHPDTHPNDRRLVAGLIGNSITIDGHEIIYERLFTKPGITPRPETLYCETHAPRDAVQVPDEVIHKLVEEIYRGRQSNGLALRVPECQVCEAPLWFHNRPARVC